MVFKKHNEHQAQLLSSNKIYENLIEDNDVFEKILKVFDFNFIYDEVKDLYCADNGRPAENPVRLYKATLVQRLKGLSDPEMEYAARYDIRIKHFLGIPIQDYGFDYSTLSLFRKRLGPELFERIFQKILTQIVELGIIKNPKQQFLDSMPVLAHAALPSVTCLIYQGINGVVKRLDKELKKQVYEKTELTDGKLFHYSKAHPLFRMEKAERESAFEKAVNRAAEIIGFLELLNHKSEELDLLKQILNENVDERNKLIQTKRAVKTLVDQEAKLGHKTKEDLIFGYKNHAAVTEEGIITAVEVTSAAEKDDKQAGKIISKQEEVNLKPKEMDADSAYGYIEAFKTATKLAEAIAEGLRSQGKKKDAKWQDVFEEITSKEDMTAFEISEAERQKLLDLFGNQCYYTNCPNRDLVLYPIAQEDHYDSRNYVVACRNHISTIQRTLSFSSSNFRIQRRIHLMALASRAPLKWIKTVPDPLLDSACKIFSKRMGPEVQDDPASSNPGKPSDTNRAKRHHRMK